MAAIESESAYRALFEGMAEPIELWRLRRPVTRSTLLAANAAARRRIGEGNVGRTLLALHGADDPRAALLTGSADGGRPALADAEAWRVDAHVVAIRWGADVVAHAREDLHAVSHLLGHDLREPLRIVGMYSQLLERSASDGTRHHLDAIQSAVGQMHALIDATVAWARVDLEPMAREPVDLQALVGKIVDELAPADAHVTWSALPTVVGSPTLLRLALAQVLDNALRYRADRPCEIEVSAREAPEGWWITVADNGPGIPPDLLDQAVAPFKRLHTGPPTAGLGLATCKRVVERHGGRLVIESAPDRGTRVRLLLPVEAR